MESKVFRIALAGNPNCGKTTIFNRLTGTRQHVGNYPGVTVERKTGVCRIGDFRAEIIDLPGIYSLSSSSPEEKVAFQELLNDDIDLILNVIDAGNAQRNMYLTTQLTELDIPMLLAAYNAFRLSASEAGRVEALPAEKQPSACVACGRCVKACPQGIDVPAHLKAFAAELARRSR